MKNILMSLLVVVTIQGSAFASVICSGEIQQKALERAAQDGLESCRVGELALIPEVAQERGEFGTINLVCERHVSQESVVTESQSFLFSVPAFSGIQALNCSEATVSDNSAE
jgi:hypothetical protein